MLSWRVCATITTMLLVYIFTGRLVIAVGIGVVEVAVKMALYYFHERAWDRIRAGKHQQESFVMWFTGLPSSGKTTLANETYDYLISRGCRVEKLDGDVVRSVFPNTGFSRQDRETHIRRVGFLASLLEKNGVIVISSFVSPYEESRRFVRGICKNYVEIYVSTSLEECEKRDVKGLYAKARRGEIKSFTGIDDPYEPPEMPDIVVNTEGRTVEESFGQIRDHINRYAK
ncbi:MAG: adenylyl-sulfate kinase [Candidatus Omnitrophica bacterium]|nr:adenylyl-sulfate kinase [Candidatus Omnitrophota bacterium]